LNIHHETADSHGANPGRVGQTGKRFLRGILRFTGSTSVAFEANQYALPVSSLWQL